MKFIELFLRFTQVVAGNIICNENFCVTSGLKLLDPIVGTNLSWLLWTVNAVCPLYNNANICFLLIQRTSFSHSNIPGKKVLLLTWTCDCVWCSLWAEGVDMDSFVSLDERVHDLPQMIYTAWPGYRQQNGWHCTLSSVFVCAHYLMALERTRWHNQNRIMCGWSSFMQAWLSFTHLNLALISVSGQWQWLIGQKIIISR